jgi:Flp pilus assembly protein TadD
MANMARAPLVVVIVIVAATAAPPASASREPAVDEAGLISGTALELAPGAGPFALPTGEDVFALDEQMREFVAPLVEIRDPRQKMVALIHALDERGMFALQYSEVTRTASATFHERQGNCLSFTMLFVGLARAAGLAATYQTVDVPPTWSNDGQVVIASHVNSVVKTGSGQETIVDFNVRTFRGEQRSRRVSDTYALGLFYTNLGAEALVRGEYALSLGLLREAARVHPGVAGLWVNLGVLYAKHGRYEHAEAAYLKALELDDGEHSALGNLALVYAALGETELAGTYRARVQAYRERNPYYHYSIAARAYEANEYEDALLALRKALRLKSDEHQFYSLRGEVLSAMGRSREATSNFERAREFQNIEDARSESLLQREGAPLRR